MMVQVSKRGDRPARTQPGNRQLRWGCALRHALIAMMVAMASAPASAQNTEGDPFGSYQWPVLRKDFLGAKAKPIFDARIKVQGPAFAEDPMNVPITLDVSDIADIERVMVIVDRNPIRKVLEFEPMQARPVLSFRFKLEQSSPVRVVVRTRKGQWLVGGTMVDASGGGCTVPGATRADGSWSRTLGQVTSRVFPLPDGVGERLRLRVMHPMDTGLVAGIPAFYIKHLTLTDAGGKPLTKLALFEPVSENPILSFEFAQATQRPIRVAGMDNNGNRIHAEVQ